MSQEPSTSNPAVAARTSLDREKLDAVLEPIVRAHGGEVWDVELKSERGEWFLRVFVEKAGAAADRLSTEASAIDLELCSNIARELSPALDVVDVIPQKYTLEISSPGVERKLRREQDFLRFAGKKAKIRVLNPVRGQKVVVGILGPMVEGKVSIQDGGAAYEIPLSEIESARLVFDFGPALSPRPPRKSGKPGKKQRH